jgi:hypothetical protein
MEESERIKPQERANLLLDTSKSTSVIPDVIGWERQPNKDSYLAIIDSVWEDSGLEDWSKKQTITEGGSLYMWEIIKNPTYNLDLLEKRQNAVKILPKETYKILSEIKKYEPTVAWIYTLPKLHEAQPINYLFPTFPVLKMINKIPYLLILFHIYRILLLPWFNLITPFMTIFTPWFYLRKTMKIKLSFKTYMNVLWKAFVVTLIRPSGNLKQDVSRYSSVMIYIVLYVYGLIQTFENSIMLRKIQKNLSEKLKSIRKFVATAEKLVRSVSIQSITPFLDSYTERHPIIIPAGMSGIYKIMTNAKVREMILSLMRAVYAIDVCAATKHMIDNNNCSLVTYSTIQETRFWNMGHVILNKKQIRNPVSLTKNLVITGPNAAGKTTYVKGLCTNIILSQTLGVACALKSVVNPVHAIGSFMRISDILGSMSLFEAETKRCADLIKQAEEIVEKGHRALYFLDEPMHSTPPIEGTATSMAVIEHIGNLTGIRLIVTTHYHDLMKLDENNNFMNISMEAIENQDGSYRFPYTIKKGASYQCIALELLKDNQLPQSVVTRAIEVKNKLCPTKIATEV